MTAKNSQLSGLAHPFPLSETQILWSSFSEWGRLHYCKKTLEEDIAETTVFDEIKSVRYLSSSLGEEMEKE